MRFSPRPEGSTRRPDRSSELKEGRGKKERRQEAERVYIGMEKLFHPDVSEEQVAQSERQLQGTELHIGKEVVRVGKIIGGGGTVRVFEAYTKDDKEGHPSRVIRFYRPIERDSLYDEGTKKSSLAIAPIMEAAVGALATHEKDGSPMSRHGGNPPIPIFYGATHYFNANGKKRLAAIVQERIEGKDMGEQAKAWRQQMETMNPEQQENFARETIFPAVLKMIQALEYLHGHNIVGVDIKPDAFFMTPEGNVILLDTNGANFMDRSAQARWEYRRDQFSSELDDAQESEKGAKKRSFGGLHAYVRNQNGSLFSRNFEPRDSYEVTEQARNVTQEANRKGDADAYYDDAMYRAAIDDGRMGMNILYMVYGDVRPIQSRRLSFLEQQYAQLPPALRPLHDIGLHMAYGIRDAREHWKSPQIDVTQRLSTDSAIIQLQELIEGTT